MKIFSASPFLRNCSSVATFRSRRNDDRRKQMVEMVGPTRYRFAQSVVPNRASGQGGLSTVHTETVSLQLCLSRPFYSHSAHIISNYITTAITSRRLRSALVTTRSSCMQERKHVINFIPCGIFMDYPDNRY